MSTTSTVEKQRMMNWTCHKCGNEWSEPIVQKQKSQQSGDHREDAFETTICDKCLDALGPNREKA